jgi:hypothetical protein
MSTSAYAKRLADIATRQYERFHLMREQEPPLAEQIRAYWSGIATFPGVQTPWSAVFVSWCVRQAGATGAEFVFAAAHSRFVYAAIRNQIAGVGVFRGHAPNAYAPQVGDIVHNNRGQNQFAFEFATTHKMYESHSAIVIEVGVDSRGRYLRTAGGNESDSVGLKEVRLTPSGAVKNASALYISIIQTLK